MFARLTPALVAVTLLVGCAAQRANAPSASSSTPAPEAPGTSAAPSPAPTGTALPPGAIRFSIVPERSMATVRVREQVAGIPAPGEAVLTTSAFDGALVVLADGTFAAGSGIAVRLDTLASDSDLRDEWIKVNTLQTRRYPLAEIAPEAIGGVPFPLPERGEWSAELRGMMKIHGTQRSVLWPLTITRTPEEVRAVGALTFRFGDYGMAVPANRMILSVVDEIRLHVDIVARQGL